MQETVQDDTLLTNPAIMATLKALIAAAGKDGVIPETRHEPRENTADISTPQSFQNLSDALLKKLELKKDKVLGIYNAVNQLYSTDVSLETVIANLMLILKFREDASDHQVEAFCTAILVSAYIYLKTLGLKIPFLSYQVYEAGNLDRPLLRWLYAELFINVSETLNNIARGLMPAENIAIFDNHYRPPKYLYWRDFSKALPTSKTSHARLLEGFKEHHINLNWLVLIYFRTNLLRVERPNFEDIQGFSVVLKGAAQDIPAFLHMDHVFHALQIVITRFGDYVLSQLNQYVGKDIKNLASLCEIPQWLTFMGEHDAAKEMQRDMAQVWLQIFTCVVIKCQNINFLNFAENDIPTYEHPIRNAVQLAIIHAALTTNSKSPNHEQDLRKLKQMRRILSTIRADTVSFTPFCQADTTITVNKQATENQLEAMEVKAQAYHDSLTLRQNFQCPMDSPEKNAALWSAVKTPLNQLLIKAEHIAAFINMQLLALRACFHKAAAKPVDRWLPFKQIVECLVQFFDFLKLESHQITDSLALTRDDLNILLSFSDLLSSHKKNLEKTGSASIQTLIKSSTNLGHVCIKYINRNLPIITLTSEAAIEKQAENLLTDFLLFYKQIPLKTTLPELPPYPGLGFTTFDEAVVEKEVIAQKVEPSAPVIKSADDNAGQHPVVHPSTAPSTKQVGQISLHSDSSGTISNDSANSYDSTNSVGPAPKNRHKADKKASEPAETDDPQVNTNQSNSSKNVDTSQLLPAATAPLITKPTNQSLFFQPTDVNQSVTVTKATILMQIGALLQQSSKPNATLSTLIDELHLIQATFPPDYCDESEERPPEFNHRG
jgi:hypothetical protein